MRVLGIIAVAVVVLFSDGCDYSKKKKDKKVVVFPSFAAEPFSYIKESLSLALTNARECEAELRRNNTASRRLGEAMRTVVENRTDSHKLAKLAQSMATFSYAQTLFYNCDMQLQASQGGAVVVADDSSKVVWRAYWKNGVRVDDEDSDEESTAPNSNTVAWNDTRFIEWEERKDASGNIPTTDGEANEITGKIISLYKQTENTATDGDNRGTGRTLIELNKSSQLRQISATFYLSTPLTDTKDNTVMRSYLVEHMSGADKEHLLSLRLHHHEDRDTIYLALAHLKSSGSAVLIATCANNATNIYNESCADTALSDVYYFDVNQAQITTNLPTAQFKSTQAEFLTNTADKWGHGTYDKNKLSPLSPFFPGDSDLSTNNDNFFKEGLPE